MTDKELLEDAAKAAGIPTVIWNDGTEPYSSGEGFIQINNHIWNPLTDDGDALRLAVKLDMRVKSFPAGARVGFQNDILDTCEVEVTSEQDKYAATRRAIVRAAAEIGKETKWLNTHTMK